jgi:hypothetical protein
MTRLSAIVLIIALACAPAISFARRGASSRGTNSAGTAQSSADARYGNNEGNGLGTGRAKEPDTPSADTIINQENAILDRKLKGICRGC